MSRATQLERLVSKGQMLQFTFTQDKVADSQSAVAMNLIETKTSRPKVTLVDGGSAGNLTLTGITTADTLLFVGHFSTKATLATLGDLTAEFTITAADTINNTSGTDTTNDQLFVMWHDADADADILAITEAQIPWEFEAVGVSVTSTEARTAGTLTADVTIDGTATGLQAALDATNTTRDYGTQARGTDLGAAGGRVGVKLTTASWTPVSADIAATVFVMAHIEGY
jgi:Ni,Fe-hydrogenase maturation factor